MITLKTVSFALVTLFALSSATAAGTGAVSACTSSPSYAFNGLLPIEYPRPGGTASVRRICGAAALDIETDLRARARNLGVPVRWVEVYRISKWTAVFHDTIYKSRRYGYDQTGYRKYTALTFDDSANLVYANNSGKFLGMISQEIKNPASPYSPDALFILYGN